MKRILKLSLLVLLVLSLVIVFTGCGKKDEPKETKPVEKSEATEAPKEEEPKEEASAKETTEDEKVTIRYWSTNRHDKAYIDETIEKFNKENDKIFIDYEVYAENFSQMIDLAFSTDSAPDIFQLPLQVNDTVPKGYIAPLDDFMDDEYKARFGENAFIEGVNMVDGKIYSLPYTSSECRLFYNQSIFEKVGIEGPPVSLEQMVEYAKKITDELKGEGIYGFACNFASPGSSILRSVDPIVQKSGGVREGYDFKAGKFDFSSYKPVVEAFREIFNGGYGFPGSESMNIDPLRTQFAAGKIGMYLSVSHAEPGVYATQFPTEENWNCAQVPSVGGEVKGKQQLWYGGYYYGISSKTKYPQEAWEVFKYIHSDEVLKGYFEANLGEVMIPTAKEGANPPETYIRMPDLQINDNDANWPALPANLVVEGKLYADVFVAAIFGQIDVDAAIEDLNTRYNAAYDKLVDEGAERIIYPNFDPINQDLSK